MSTTISQKRTLQDITTTSSGLIENYKMQIMEKDKTIFELSRIKREHEKQIESMQKEIHSKSESIKQLKHNLDKTTSKLHQCEIIISKHKETIHELHAEFEKQITSLTNDNVYFQNKTAELEKALLNMQDDIKQSIQEYQSLDKDNLILQDTLNEKLALISKYEELFDKLNEDNKLIPSLKKKIIDLENALEQNKNEISSLQTKNERIQIEKKEIDSKLKNAINDTQKDKFNIQKINKLTFEVENLRKDYNYKEKENNTLNDKYKTLIKENDNFVHSITSELSQFTNYLENVNASTQIPLSYNNNNNNVSSSNVIGNVFALKYEIVIKSIETLKSKVIELINADLTRINKLTSCVTEIENSNKQLLIDNENIQNENAIYQHKLKETETQTQEIQNQYTTLNNTYMKLKDKHIKLKQSYEDITYKNENNTKETQNVFTSLYSKLMNEEYVFCNGNDPITTSNKMINQINNIISENAQLRIEISELKNNNDKMKERLTQLTEENNIIQSKNTLLEQNINEQLNYIESSKDSEMKMQKNILYDKIKALSQLLEQSNQLVLMYEKEVKELKCRNAEVEYNLKMLTNSHMELEMNVNYNNSTLQSEIEEKEQKYYAMVNEIKLKDIHIQSLEKLLNCNGIKYDQSLIIGNLLRNTKECKSIVPQYQEDESVESSFVRNEKHEQELKNLMSCFDEKNLKSSGNKDDNISDRKIDDDNNKINNNNKRIPGKLYSIKKK